jgi:hypothetical protein
MKAFITALVSCLSFGMAFGQDPVQAQKTDSTAFRTVCAPSNLKINAPLYIVDDMETCPEDIKALPTDDIESINILKNAKDIESYGEKGKYGVILIAMKKKTKSLKRKN